MKTYYIRTIHDNLICGYDYIQFKEVVESLKRRNIEFTTWTSCN